jgi:hypothetical protein
MVVIGLEIPSLQGLAKASKSGRTMKDKSWSDGSCLVQQSRNVQEFDRARPPGRRPLRANIDETLTAATITEQGGKENHRERSQDCCSFCSQFDGDKAAGSSGRPDWVDDSLKLVTRAGRSSGRPVLTDQIAYRFVIPSRGLCCHQFQQSDGTRSGGGGGLPQSRARWPLRAPFRRSHQGKVIPG